MFLKMRTSLLLTTLVLSKKAKQKEEAELLEDTHHIEAGAIASGIVACSRWTKVLKRSSRERI